MRRRQILAMAIVWTLLMAMSVQLRAVSMPWSIVITTAYVWFVIGRFSCRQDLQVESEAADKPRWGRDGVRGR